jgi:ADP-ribose pyrophosphatase
MYQMKKRIHSVRGTAHTFYYLPHPGAVGVVALKEKKIAMVRQYRPAIDKVFLEIPAGTLEAGEDPVTCAKRELQEETGLICGQLAPLGGFFPACGYSSEYLHLFLATDLSFGQQNFDDGEEIEDVVWVDMDGFAEMIASHDIQDGKSIIAYYLLRTYVK